MFPSILQLIGNIIPISKELESALQEKMIIESYPKKTILLKPGVVASHVYFILKGMIRAYYMRNGRPVTRLFLKENDIAISALSFLKREPSDEYLETLEEVEVAIIHYQDLMALYQEFIEFNTVGRMMTERYYIKCEEHRKGLVQTTAKEKYRKMLTHSAELITRLPLKYIATYLDMTVENLSKVRAKIK